MENDNDDDEAYDQRQSMRGPSGAMWTQPTSTSKYNTDPDQDPMKLPKFKLFTLTLIPNFSKMFIYLLLYVLELKICTSSVMIRICIEENCKIRIRNSV